MLHGLIGSKSVERILLFLLVNERCYASQLHRILQTPLTPLQKALDRLEQAGIVKSALTGKTRLFEFNSDYPLLHELETLLKKAYTLLTPQEKKQFYFISPHASLSHKGKSTLLTQLWSELRAVSKVSLVFRSGKQIVGEGTGTVEVEYDEKATLVFREHGKWTNAENQQINFCNTFRWTLSRPEGVIALEHLRFGPNRPVFLFHLSPASHEHLESVHAHLCAEDSYFGFLMKKPKGWQLIWRILGPKKNDEIHYHYY